MFFDPTGSDLGNGEGNDGQPPADAGDGAAEPAGRDLWTVSDEAAWTAQGLGWEGLLEEASRLGPDPQFADRSDAQLVEDLAVGAAQLAAATCRWLEFLAEFVIRGVWAEQGARTPTQWLSWKLGTAPSTGREHVRVALRLRELPLIRETFARGHLSYSKVRALTRVGVPGIEPMLLEWADSGTAADLERIARSFGSYRRGLAPDEDATDDGRWSIRMRGDGHGTSAITLRLPDDEAAELMHQLRRLAAQQVADRLGGRGKTTDAAADSTASRSSDATGTGERSTGNGESSTGSGQNVPGGGDGAQDRNKNSCGRLDDLGAQTDEASQPGDVQPGDDDAYRVTPRVIAEALVHVVAAAAGERTPTDTSGLDRHTLVVQVTEAGLVEGRATEPVEARDDAGHHRVMSRATVRRLACAGGIVLAVTDAEGSPLDIGRRRRLTAALRRAVQLRDRGCTFPGCAASLHLHVHHVQHWADGGPSDLANLVTVCGFHHRFVHEHDWEVEIRSDGRHRYSPPGQPPAEPAPRLPGASAEAVHSKERRRLDEDSLRPDHYLGPARYDLDAAIAALEYELAASRQLALAGPPPFDG